MEIVCVWVGVGCVGVGCVGVGVWVGVGGWGGGGWVWVGGCRVYHPCDCFALSTYCYESILLWGLTLLPHKLFVSLPAG